LGRLATVEDTLMSCPRCQSVIRTRDGITHLGGQRFRFGHCGRRFTRRSDSAFSCRAFPHDVIALAVRYRLSYAQVSEWLAERGVLVDQSTIYRWMQRLDAVRRGGSKVPRARSSGLASGRDLRSDPCVRIADARHGCRALVLRAAIASSGTTPRRVITDKAPSYPPALTVAVPGVLHRTGRYRTHGLERDHGFSEGEAPADARPQVRYLGGDLHTRSRPDAQHPPSVLSARGVSAGAAGPCLDLEPAGRGRIGRPGRRRPFGRQSATVAASPPPHRCKRSGEPWRAGMGMKLE
jgi:transposase-like protein